jgi:hypothetical protein
MRLSCTTQAGNYVTKSSIFAVRLAGVGDPMGGGLVGEEEPAFVVDTR